MMHALILLGSLGLALVGRTGGWWWYRRQVGWSARWTGALLTFTLPPLLLLSSALAVVWMGWGGNMAAGQWGSTSYGLAFLMLGVGGCVLGVGAAQGYQSEASARQLPLQVVQHQAVRVAPSPRLWAAQVGWWDPCLVLSQGVLDRLSPGHLRAVLLHEQAHTYFRDPLVFLLLGWLQRLSGFLPQTAALWQELLILREVRADRWTLDHTDGLDLAEALWRFAAEGYPELEGQWAIGLTTTGDPWAERMEAILSPEPTHPSTGIPWLWWLLAALPLLAVPLHH